MEEVNKINDVDLELIWPTFAKALNVELRPDKVVKGASGLEHAVQAIAVDDKSKRVIIVSPEANPRMAAMVQADVQASLSEARVLVARPVAIDLVGSIGKVAQALGFDQIDVDQARDWLESQKNPGEANGPIALPLGAEAAISSMVGPISKLNLPGLPFFMNLVHQAGNLPWQEISAIFGETAASGTVDFNKLAAQDNLEADLSAGVCPIPLYEFDDTDIDVMIRGNDIELCRHRLMQMGIYQYFYPSADQVALAVVDRGISSREDIIRVSTSAPNLGHPFGESELVPTTTRLVDTLDQLQDLGYVAEGEHGVEVSDTGTIVRSTIKFRPREGFVTKLLNRMSFSATISGSDLIK